MNSRMATFMALAMSMGGLSSLKKEIDPLEGIDIEEEYKLIKQKKSTLSSNKRRMLVEEHERYLKQKK